jgi:hypothetical protein
MSGAARNFNWLLTSFVRNTADTREAVAVSSDGFLLASSSNTARDGVEQYAAIISGVTSLTNGAGDFLGCGEFERIMVEMEGGMLFVATISDGSALGVLTDKSCDMGLIGYEMTLLLSRAGKALTPALVKELKNALTG